MKVNSASADGGPRSRVCPCSVPIITIFRITCLGGGIKKIEIFWSIFSTFQAILSTFSREKKSKKSWGFGRLSFA